MKLFLWLLLASWSTSSVVGAAEHKRKLKIKNEDAVKGLKQKQQRRNLRPRVGKAKKASVDVIAAVSVLGGAEFDDPDSYQNRALEYVQVTRGLSTVNEEFKVYYGLACIYLASSGVHNKYTLARFPELDTLPEWLTRDNWMSTSNYCTWWGITCNNRGEITELTLSANRLFGTFAPEVQHLARTLEEIELFNNFFLLTEGDAGNEWIGKMSNLKNLFFGTTSFEYDGVPSFLGGLSKLEQLDMSNTFFTEGPIRGKAFEGQPVLRYVDMADNIYRSFIPRQLTEMEGLKFLYMDNVLFDGVGQTLDFLVGMPQLVEAWMDFTFFVGSIPTGVGELRTLQSLSLTFCGLTGPIPSELGNLERLDRLWLYQNSLEGTIPPELGNLERMRFMFFEGNRLGGSMPPEICVNRAPFGILAELGADCSNSGTFTSVDCSCCTCCGGIACNDFAV